MWLFDVLRVLLDLLVFIFFSSGLPSFRSLLPYRLALARHNRSWCLNTRSLNQSLWRLLPRIRTLQWVCFCFCRAGRKQQCQRIRDFWKFANCMNSNQVFPRWIVLVGELYSAADDPQPQMIPRPQMIPKMDRKWSPKSTANDPERKMGMTWTQVSGSLCRFYYYYNKSG